jgi:Rrf2 family protein
MNNNRFAVSMHILTLLADAKAGELLSSDFMAGSININPVLVRKELANLRKHGLVATREGKNGGCYLAKPASAIYVAQVYQAVKQHYLLGQNKTTPNPACPIGRQINQHLDDLYAHAEQALLNELGNITLEKFVARFV